MVYVRMWMSMWKPEVNLFSFSRNYLSCLFFPLSLFYVYGCLVWAIGVYRVPSSQESSRSPGTRITKGCEPPCGCRELNQGPLEKMPLFTPLSHLSNWLYWDSHWDLNLTKQLGWQGSEAQRSACACLPSSGILRVDYHAQLFLGD